MQTVNNQTQTTPTQKAPALSPIIFERDSDNIVYVLRRDKPPYGSVISVFNPQSERMKLIVFNHDDDGDGKKRTRYGLRSQIKLGGRWNIANAIVWVALVEEAA
ncbi:hypothetical protein [Candidatus Bathycorpusculum sp.]|uniref:hypothetical protein n=1 Tax=Candidatus Bathycorpusculum sp. TaxID=2994959 RepID=UPI00281A8496|nr:hypothetical protein [Candidatus Termitimicrobium sp.]MCL2432690.1 hypothetical protein [Candidatus Termitimicrobium sp.]